MKYFAIYDDAGNLTAFGATSAKVVKHGEITADEYAALKVAHTAKLAYTEQVVSGEITLDDVPEEYREAVAAMVEDMQAQPDTGEISDAEALAIITGVSE